MNLIDLIVSGMHPGQPWGMPRISSPVSVGGSPRACTMQAQPYLAQWIGEHPNLRVARWHCAWPQQEDEKT